MPAGMRRWLRCTKEATYGTFNETPGTDEQIWVRLVGNNDFTVMPKTNGYEIVSCDAIGEAVQYDNQVVSVDGNLNTLAYPSQGKFFLDQSTGIASSGTPAEWKLPSFTCDYFDGVRTRRYLGCQINAATLSFGNSGPGTWGFQVVAWKPDATDPTLTEPAITAFPSDLPFTLQQTAGTLKIGANTARTKYQELSFKWENKLARVICETPYHEITYCGRKITVNAKIIYKASEVDRAAYEGVTTLGKNLVTLARTGYHTWDLDFQTKSKLTGFSTEHSMADVAYANLEAMAMFDVAPTPDGSFTYTVTAPS